MSTPEPLPVEGSDLDERIDALQRSIEWRSTELLVQTLRKLNAWQDGTKTDAAERIARLEAAKTAEQDELRRLEARQHLFPMLRQAQPAAQAEGLEAGHWMARVLNDGHTTDVIALRPEGR